MSRIRWMLWGLTGGSLLNLFILQFANHQIGDPFKGPQWTKSFAGLCIIEFVLLMSTYKFLDFFARRFHHRHIIRASVFTISVAVVIVIIGWTIVFYHDIPPINNLTTVLAVLLASGGILLYLIMLFVPFTAPPTNKKETAVESPPPKRQEEHFRTDDQTELSPDDQANYLADIELRRWGTRLQVSYGYTALLVVLFLAELLYLFGVHVPVLWQLHRNFFPSILCLIILLLFGSFAALLAMSVCTAYKMWYTKEVPILLSPEGLMWIVYTTPLAMSALILSSWEWYIILASIVLTLISSFFVVKKILLKYYFPVVDEYEALHGKK